VNLSPRTRTLKPVAILIAIDKSRFSLNYAGGNCKAAWIATSQSFSRFPKSGQTNTRQFEEETAVDASKTPDDGQGKGGVCDLANSVAYTPEEEEEGVFGQPSETTVLPERGCLLLPTSPFERSLRQTLSRARCQQCACEEIRLGRKEITYDPASQNDARRT
jgi:hypothetical protein